MKKPAPAPGHSAMFAALLCLALVSSTQIAAAQSRPFIEARANSVLIPSDSPTSAGTSSHTPATELLREIDDPHTGAHWLLYRDRAHPAGPERLVLADAVHARPSRALSARSGPASTAPPIIHPGDPVTLEEHTPIVEAHLQAIALGPASVGSLFRLRLAIGGKVMLAIAIAPGRAVLPPQPEAEP
jgi:hypothetical protein